MDPLDPSEAQLAEFCLILFKDRRLAPETVKGYRSAIGSVLKPRGLDVGAWPNLSALIRRMELERPARRSLTPTWNLSLVLRFLMGPEFEPLESASLERLTQKTVFLVALASGRRRSEIHALSVADDCMRWKGDGSEVSFLTMPGFLAKNQKPTELSPWIHIPSLEFVSDRNDGEVLLCPVRAIRRYIEATRVKRATRTRLFIPSWDALGDVKPAQISSWITRVIVDAHSSVSDQDLGLAGVRAHEVRAISASWAALNRVGSVDEILQAAFWKTRETFVKFYLKDMCKQAMDLYSLGPFVSSQRVIRPPSSPERPQTSFW